jgi:hypothetical protein
VGPGYVALANPHTFQDWPSITIPGQNTKYN